MEEFVETIRDASRREKLCQALNGKKPFRHFKDTLNYIGLDEAYYSFRSEAFIQIAKQWCKDNDIPYRIRAMREEQ